ncbi:hypothetical protein FB451DRAFT_1373328 [Mycena latifolia]|nr:hypothetical protein FB451DRAFT_1373328 [Mycena latifolia]
MPRAGEASDREMQGARDGAQASLRRAKMELCSLARAQHHKAHPRALGHEQHRLRRADGAGAVVHGGVVQVWEGDGAYRLSRRQWRSLWSDNSRSSADRTPPTRGEAIERAVDASRSTDEMSDSMTPHAARAGAPRESAGGVPWVSWPRRLSASSGGEIRAVCGRASEEPRMYASAGYAARASRAEGASPRDSHNGGAGSARQVGASCARSPSSPAYLVSCLSDTAAPARGAKARALTYSLTYQSPRASICPRSPLLNIDHS